MRRNKLALDLGKVTTLILGLISSAKFENVTEVTEPEPAVTPVLADLPQKTPEEVKDILIKSKIMPDVITLPASHVVQVAYGEHIVNFGNNLTRATVDREPTYVKWPTKKGAYYTIILSDPDYPKPSLPKLREYFHWIVVNIPECDIKKGDVLGAYLGSQVPRNTGYHRFVFTVYWQPEKIKYDEFPRDNVPLESYRGRFSTDKFGRKYNFGDPHAVNYFMSTWSNLDGSEFVPIAKMYD